MRKRLMESIELSTRDSAVGAGEGSKRRVVEKERWLRRLAAQAPLGALVVLSLFFTAATPRFFSGANLVNILDLAPILVIATLGETLIIVMGSIDLSLEGVAALASVVTGFVVKNPLTSVDLSYGAILIAMAVGGLAGLVNGWLHVKARIPSFMVTLGVGFVAGGLAVYLIKGNPIPVLDPSIQQMAIGRTLGIPNLAWGAFVVSALLYLLERRTAFGRHIFAIGGQEVIARQLGVSVDRMKVAAFTLAGVLYGIVGFLNTARLASGNAATSQGLLFSAITATVVGGTALTGGIGGVVSGVIGALTVTVLTDGMILMGINPYVQGAVQGLVLVAAVALTLDRKKIGVIK